MEGEKLRAATLAAVAATASHRPREQACDEAGAGTSAGTIHSLPAVARVHEA
jgi:hypothetical protein